jgi:hypothetical protein
MWLGKTWVWGIVPAMPCDAVYSAPVDVHVPRYVPCGVPWDGSHEHRHTLSFQDDGGCGLLSLCLAVTHQLVQVYVTPWSRDVRCVMW